MSELLYIFLFFNMSMTASSPQPVCSLTLTLLTLAAFQLWPTGPVLLSVDRGPSKRNGEKQHRAKLISQPAAKDAKRAKRMASMETQGRAGHRDVEQSDELHVPLVPPWNPVE